MAFVDELTITAKAGDGGDGVERWRHEKYKPLAGPSGGNGGRGGDVYVRAVRDRMILSKYRAKPSFHATAGDSGGKDSLEGKNGKDYTIDLPVGSRITNTETKEEIALEEEGEEILLLRGGSGGLGNEHFKSAENRAPTETTPGRAGESGVFRIELSLIADIGLIGFPNAGKSSLLNALTNAHSKVGEYPFTTLEPSLGVMDGYVLADIPGLIEGAADGKGLGHRFLKHITRTRILLHLISAKRDMAKESYEMVRKELMRFDPALLEKPEIVLLTQVDECDSKEMKAKIEDLLSHPEVSEVLPVSVLDEELLKRLRERLLAILHTG